MSAKYLDEALVLRAVLLDALELETRGAEGSRRRVAQAPDRRRALARQIDQILGEHANDAVTSGVDLADVATGLERGLDDAAGGGVDHGRDAAGLGIERIAWGGLI